MKTLYVRVVLTFLVVIVIGLLSSFVIGFALFQQKLNNLGQSDMIVAGDKIVQLSQQTQYGELDSFMTNVSALTSYSLLLFNDSGEKKSYGTAHKGETVSPESVQHVLNGESYRSATKSVDELYVGLPLQFEGKQYALIILTSSKNEAAIIQLVVTILLLVLIIGSLCILVAARYLVKPIQALTKATKRLAKGNFDVALKVKRKDELGALAQSFNEMASELKQLERMRQDFVSNVSHEIQSPLTSISGFAEALKSDHLVAAERRGRYLDIIVTESERLSRLSDNLLKLASLESEHHPFEARTFNLDEQIRQVVVSCEPLWAAKHLHLDLNLPSALKITADPDQLNQVWMNLLGNSIKFTPEGGTIAIGLAPEGKGYTITITDSGIGIPAADLGHIFDRFYKADRSRRSGSGSGLGLAIVKQIIALHHGDIEVERADVKGTKVTVKLPRLHHADREQPEILRG
ncbi:HAMP domain-containing protein [Paenibacillaceae bacterium]|nr:HAMP domain-containing protein [Paenibacillaceae bacterium]